MLEGQILSLLSCDREAYDSLQPFIENSDFSTMGQIVLKEVQHFYEMDCTAPEVDIDIIRSRIERSYPTQSNTINTVLDNITNISVPNALHEYFEFKKHSLSTRIGALMINGEDSQQLRDLLDSYNALVEAAGLETANGNEYDVYEGEDLLSSLDALEPDNLIKVYPESLNERLGGGVQPGTHIVIFARPETGKSMFVINIACEFIRQGLKVLYIGNEDPAKGILNRIHSNLLGMNKDDLLANKNVVNQMLTDSGVTEYLKFVQLNPGSVYDCKKCVNIYTPDILIVDQIRNLTTSKQYTKVEALEEVAKSVRDIGKAAGCVTVSVTQAGNSAEDKLILDMGDVDFSNTGIPATADVMIGIGVTPEYDMMGKRVISLPKNKVSGVHEHFTVDVIPELSTVRSCE